MNKHCQVDRLLELRNVSSFEKSQPEQVRSSTGSVYNGDIFADTFTVQQTGPMIFLLTQEIIKMWNKLVLCKLCKTLKNSLEKRKEEKEHSFTHASVLGPLG